MSGADLSGLDADIAEVLRSHDFDSPDALYQPEVLAFARAAERVAGTFVKLRKGLLSTAEHQALSLLGQVWTLASRKIVGGGPTRDADLTELAAHIHAIQNMILAQAATRAYPDHYRGLGEVAGGEP